jgi:hypothetical protein
MWKFFFTFVNRSFNTERNFLQSFKFKDIFKNICRKIFFCFGIFFFQCTALLPPLLNFPANLTIFISFVAITKKVHRDNMIKVNKFPQRDNYNLVVMSIWKFISNSTTAMAVSQVNEFYQWDDNWWLVGKFQSI